MSTPATFATVLRSGGDFDPRWVTALRNGVRQYMIGPHRFVCLTDTHEDVSGRCVVTGTDVDAIPLRHDWPGWWAKLELLDPTLLSGRVVAMDLDTLPVGNLYRLGAVDWDFAMLRALNEAKAKAGKLISGVLCYRAGQETEAARLYDLFASDPERWMRAYRGDGEFLAAQTHTAVGIQDHVDGIVSYKWEAPDERPVDACLVLGHGQPRFSDPAARWAHEEWMRRAA